MPRKKVKADGPRFVAQNRYVWMDYIDPDQPDAPAFRVRIRADLTFGEANTLTFEKDTLITEVWELLAPFVVDWNLDDVSGNQIPPPAEGGGKQFDFMPNGIFWKLWGDVKFRSTGAIDSKRSTEFASLAVTGSDANSANET